jgi:hypothetical protein
MPKIQEGKWAYVIHLWATACCKFFPGNFRCSSKGMRVAKTWCNEENQKGHRCTAPLTRYTSHITRQTSHVRHQASHFERIFSRSRLTSGGALSMSSKRTSFPVITATASAPGCSRVSNYKQNGENVRPKSALHTCHLNSPGVSVQLRGRY